MSEQTAEIAYHPDPEVNAETTEQTIEAEREFIAVRLCTSHQMVSPTRIPCAACTSEVDTLVDAARREGGAEALREAADCLPALTEGVDRAGTETWRAHDRDVYSLAIEESQAALRDRAARYGGAR
jgi:hypothetical protein